MEGHNATMNREEEITLSLHCKMSLQRRMHKLQVCLFSSRNDVC
jgi:hypothetical protein